MRAASQLPAAPAHDRPPDRLARWAVALTAVFGVAVGASVIGWAVGGDSFMDDNLWFSVTASLVGVGAAVAAFVTAAAALIRGERRDLLWVALAALPALVVFLVLGEAFWWE